MGDRRQQRKDQVQDRMQQKIHKAKKANSGESRRIRNICVYCGSNVGTNPAYAAAARQLGQSMAKERIGLVYGGGGLGLMGELARAVLAHGGRVTGIIPAFLSVKERMLRDVTELVVVDDMHQRKKLMFDKSDAFVALPGGIGTLEELVEQLTWAQLGRHTKPIVLVNIDEFYAPFLALMQPHAGRGRLHPRRHGRALHHRRSRRATWCPPSSPRRRAPRRGRRRGA